RGVVDEVQHEAHRERPEGERERAAQGVGQILGREGLVEQGDALVADALGFPGENRELARWIPDAAEERREELSIALDPVELRVEDDAKPTLERVGELHPLSRERAMRFLRAVVVREDERVLAREVIVRGAQCDAGSLRHVAHRRTLEAALPEKPERGLED